MAEIIKWPPSEIQLADSKEKILALIQEGYRLCVEPDLAFMCEGYVFCGQDRPRIPVTEEAVTDALDGYELRQMTDQEVRHALKLDPRNRQFYLAVM